MTTPSAAQVDAAKSASAVAGGWGRDNGLSAPHAPVKQTRSLLDSILESGQVSKTESASTLEQFLGEKSTTRALRLWIGGDSAAADFQSKRALQLQLTADIALIDQLLNEQINAIIHHPRFQQLESSWRGLRYLVDQADRDDNVIFRVLNVGWSELVRDSEMAMEFDQSQLFRKVYSEEFDLPGGTPYGLLIGDYQIRHRTGPGHTTDDIGALASIAQVAAASFSPFIAGADPALFGVEDFAQLDRPMSLDTAFEQVEYVKWNSLRQTEDARFVGLTAPRVLMRTPYVDDNHRTDQFRFIEDVDGPDTGKYLWGNASYAFASVVVRAFVDSGWLAEIRGVRRGEIGGGLLTDLPVHSFGTDALGVVTKSSTDLILSEELEKQLSDLGFIPLSHCADTMYSAFYGNQSIQRPKVYDQQAAKINARISAMLQYILCASRIAHYLKVVAREKVGSFAEADQLEDYLKRWVANYVAPDAEAPDSVKAKFPLREAQVQVRERPGSAGEYYCTMHLLPHYQLDAMAATVRLNTELAPHRPV